MARNRRTYWLALGVIALGIAVWFAYQRVWSKPAGVPLDSTAVIDSSGAGQDTTTETKILIKDG